VFASVPDILRLFVVPVFGYLAWRDVKTRRIPNRTWYPLAALALVLLAWEIFAVTTGDVRSIEQRRFFLRVAISVLFLIPLSYAFWLLGGFGGADAKAFMIVALLFPTYPSYDLGVLGLDSTLPTVPTDIEVFSLTILSNTVLVGALYPVALAAKNAASGYVSPGMFVAKPIPWEQATEEYGTMLEFSDRGLTDDLSLSGLRSYFSWRSLDLDALRMYLQWRGCSLADLREDPATFRDPASLPEEPNPPGDGSMAGEEPTAATDGGTPPDDDVPTDEGTPTDEEESHDDPWGAEAFLDDIEGSAYGTSPEVLRDGLETLVDDDVIWISPGIPFIVPLFAGLVVAFSFGDILFALLGLFGFV
jgi:preflagellin peptidase FlaK